MGILGDTEPHPIAYVNGKKLNLPLGKAEITLLQYLRGDDHLLCPCGNGMSTTLLALSFL